jgi:hypothetical protein
MSDPKLVAEWVQNPFEAETRYPGYFADKNDARIALAAMKEVRKFVRSKLGLK